MRYLIFIVEFLLLSIVMNAQNNNNQKFKISINQVCLPGPNPEFTYKVSGNSIRILRTRRIIRQKVRVTDEIYSCRLNRKNKDSLNLIINKIDLSKLENSYASAVLDGVVWDFTISSDRGSKKVSLWNYFLPEFGTILDFINRQLPENKRYISFDILGIRKMFKNK